MKAKIGNLKMRELEAMLKHSMPLKFLPRLYIEVKGDVCLCG